MTRLKVVLACLLAPALSFAAGKAIDQGKLSDADFPESACSVSKTKISGSLHAAVGFDTPITKPRDKLHLSYKCKGGEAALYLLDYGSEAESKSNAGFHGAQLWGGNAPTADHSDEVLRKDGLVAIISGRGQKEVMYALQDKGFVKFRIGQASAGEEDVPDARIDEMKKQLDCGSAIGKSYCPALEAFKKGKPLTAKVSLPGRSVGLAEQKGGTFKTIEEASYLVSSATRVKYGSIAPENPEEEKQVAEFIATLAAGKPLPKSDPLLGYVKTLKAEDGGRELRSVGKSTVMVQQNPIFIRESGKQIVVIEAAARGKGFFVGVFSK